MGKLAIGLLGSFPVTLDGTPVRAFESDKVRALLAYLAVEAHQAHSREKLAELLWPERPEEHARRSLSQALYNLRSALQERQSEAPPLLGLTPQTIQFNPLSECERDVAEFTRLIEACDRHPHSRVETCTPCQERFQKAVSLYHGDFLADFSLRDSAAFEAWRLAMQERYRLLTRGALSSLAAYHEQEGQSGQALEYARRLAQLDPLDEDACRGLMRLLAACGKRSEAMACYESYRRLLKQELDAAPDRETSALYERIRLEEGLQQEVPRPPHNLPASLSPLIGREAELAELQRRLLDPACRLITVLGPGGSGKTRLALEAARGLLENYPHGVYLIPLVPLGSTEAILPTLASTFGLRLHEKSPPLAQVLDYLRQKEILLLMDSFESLLEGVELVLEMLNASSGLKVLATSRTRLNAAYEQIYPLEGLEYPASEDLGDAMNSAAVRLFASGARRVQPGFGLTADHLKDVVGICRLVRGMPLALLLAASWVEVLSPTEIYSELQSSYDLLRSDWTDLPARQRSMRASFDYSWQHLDGREQSTFSALSVFRGSFSPRAAEQVSDAGPQELRALVGKSLLQRLPDGRYQIHDLLRQFASERLSQLPKVEQAVQERHAQYYTSLLTGWETALKSSQQGQALLEMDHDHDNVLSAWDWAAANVKISWLDQGLEGLGYYHLFRVRYGEGESACRKAVEGLSRTEKSVSGLLLLVRLLAWQGYFAHLRGETDSAAQLLGRSFSLLEDPLVIDLNTRREKAFILLKKGDTLRDQDQRVAIQCYQESADLYRSMGDRWGLACALSGVGLCSFHYQSGQEIESVLNESLSFFRDLGEPRGIASLLYALGTSYIYQGAIEQAEQLISESVSLRKSVGDLGEMTNNLERLGIALVWTGRVAEGEELLEQCLEGYRYLGDRRGEANSVGMICFSRCLSGDYEKARLLGKKSMDLAQTIGDQWITASVLSILGFVAIAEKEFNLAQELLQQGIETYKKWGIESHMGITMAALALLALALEQPKEARSYLLETMRFDNKYHDQYTQIMMLCALALLLVEEGKVERGVEIYIAISRHPFIANSRHFEDLAGKRITAASAGLPPDVIAAVQERGRGQDPLAALAELAEALRT